MLALGVLGAQPRTEVLHLALPRHKHQDATRRKPLMDLNHLSKKQQLATLSNTCWSSYQVNALAAESSPSHTTGGSYSLGDLSLGQAEHRSADITQRQHQWGIAD